MNPAKSRLPIGGIRTFTIQRVRTITGSGVVLHFGTNAFILANKDGTPERSLDDAGYQRIVDAIVQPAEEIPNVSPKIGQA